MIVNCSDAGPVTDTVKVPSGLNEQEIVQFGSRLESTASISCLVIVSMRWRRHQWGLSASWCEPRSADPIKSPHGRADFPQSADPSAPVIVVGDRSTSSQ